MLEATPMTMPLPRYRHGRERSAISFRLAGTSGRARAEPAGFDDGEVAISRCSAE